MNISVDYDLLAEQVEDFVDEEPFYVSALSNIAALVWASLGRINWVGFYIVRNEELTLGPFQGKVACIHIAPGKGVCGTAWKNDETLAVPDVHEFPGHIACDSASNSEIVIPIHHDGEVAAVLDIDSPLFSRFDEADRLGLEKLVRVIENSVVWD